MSHFTSAECMLYLELYLALTMVILLARRKSFLSPTVLFLVSYTALLGLAPVVELVRGGSSYVSAASMPEPFLFILGPLFAFFLGSCIGPQKKRTKTRRFSGYFDRAMLLYAAYFVCLAAGVYYIVRTGLSFGSSDFENARISAQTGMGAFTYLNGALVVILPMMFELVMCGELKRFPFAMSVIAALAVFFLRGSRTLCLVPLIIMAVCYSRRRRIERSTLAIMGSACALAVVVFALLRSQSGGGIWSGLENVMTVSYENAARLISAVPDTIPYMYGSTFVMNFNILLPGAGTDFTLWLKESLGLTFSGGGMTPSVIGDFYLNFGLAGVYVGMFLLGILGRLLERLLLRAESSIWAAFAAVQFMLLPYGGISVYVLSFTLNTAVYLVLSAISKPAISIPLDIEACDRGDAVRRYDVSSAELARAGRG